MDLDRDVDLRQGASASIANLGLLGEKYVELVPGPSAAAELPEGTTLKGDLPVSFDQITKLARDIEVDIKDITKNLSQSLGGRRARRGCARSSRTSGSSPTTCG